LRTQNHGPIFAGSLVAEEIGVIKIIQWIAAPFFLGKNGRFFVSTLRTGSFIFNISALEMII
jgi:hypothetical protein